MPLLPYSGLDGLKRMKHLLSDMLKVKLHSTYPIVPAWSRPILLLWVFPGRETAFIIGLNLMVELPESASAKHQSKQLVSPFLP